MGRGRTVAVGAGRIARAMHPATKSLLAFFVYGHLPPFLQSISRPFSELAYEMAGVLEGPELTAGLRKLLEAKDCMVRAALAAREAADVAARR